MDKPHPIVIRMATQADIDALATDASVGEAAAVDIYGKLVAVANEYGTATVAHNAHLGLHAHRNIEALIEAAVQVWPAVPPVETPEPVPYDEARGWVIVVHDVDTDIIWDVYNHEPTEEDIHSVVCDFWTRCYQELPDKRPGRIYYTDKDMPDHCGLSVGRLGKSLGSPLSRS